MKHPTAPTAADRIEAFCQECAMRGFHLDHAARARITADGCNITFDGCTVFMITADERAALGLDAHPLDTLDTFTTADGRTWHTAAL